MNFSPLSLCKHLSFIKKVMQSDSGDKFMLDESPRQIVSSSENLT